MFLPKFGDNILAYKTLLWGPKGWFELFAATLTLFDKKRDAMADAALLDQSAPDASNLLIVSASNAAVLLHSLAGQAQPLRFFCKKLSPPTRAAETFKGKLLAAYLAVKHFQHFHEGKDLTVFPHHNPLLPSKTPE
nr:unnamed protein product [Spirometra erinaceieuropaei]